LNQQKMKNLTRTGLLLALTLVFQSLRFLIPLPPRMSTFLIGSLVNAALLIALLALGMRSALLIACVTPVVAWLQQLLPLPVFILPVAVGNSLYIWLFSRLRRAGPEWLAVGSAALGKAAFFFLAFRGLLSVLELPPALSTAILFVMGWPQLVTGLVGGFIAIYAWRRLEKI
jgi:hypothetical protein